MNTKVICVSNNKGGSGKTTVTSNLGYFLGEMNKKVLLIDADMQINLTRSFDLAPNQDLNLYRALHKEESLERYIVPTKYKNVDFIVSDYMLSAIDMELVNKQLKETVFKRCLMPVKSLNKYDYIIIDTCPFLGLLNFNILVASDYVLIPVELSAFGIEGLHPLTNFISEAMIYNDNLKILGILETKVDNRESTTEDSRKLLREIFNQNILKNSIPIDINIKKSQYVGVAIGDFLDGSRASVAYKNLAKEVDKIVLEETNNK